MPTSLTTPRLRGGNRLLRADFQGIPRLPAEETMGTGEGRTGEQEESCKAPHTEGNAPGNPPSTGSPDAGKFWVLGGR